MTSLINFACRLLEETYLNQFSENDEDDSSEINGASEHEDDEMVDDLYCVACNKYFNSESAKANHENSKKHKQLVSLLRAEMLDEEENFCAEEEQSSISQEVVESEEDDQPSKRQKSKKNKKKTAKAIFHEEISETIKSDSEEITRIIDSEDDWFEDKKSSRKNKSKGKSRVEKDAPVEIVKKVAEISLEEVPSKVPDVESQNENRCATCKEIFASKNKLFIHLKKTNHSIYLGEKAKNFETSKKKKNK